ncbi:MAG: methyltransferase domain-containing protein [Firmicutes bacterium]|nr:methyltransferase domain-containing protein [Bacillota bacterium]
MRIPNFNTTEGSRLYRSTVGRQIAPRVAELLLDHIQRQLGEVAQSQCDILELGCGPGTLTIPLAQAFPFSRITATDPSEAMIELAREAAGARGLQNLTFAAVEAGKLGWAPSSFDVVVCNLAFPFFRRPYQTLRQVFKVVKPGGSVHFSVPGEHTWEEFLVIAAGVLGSAWSVAKPFLQKIQQAQQLPGALLHAGFRDLSEEHFRIPFSFPGSFEVLAFFAELFRLLDYAPHASRDILADAIDRQYPQGFQMHYEALVLAARRPALPPRHAALSARRPRAPESR